MDLLGLRVECGQQLSSACVLSCASVLVHCRCLVCSDLFYLCLHFSRPLSVLLLSSVMSKHDETTDNSMGLLLARPLNRAGESDNLSLTGPW